MEVPGHLPLLDTLLQPLFKKLAICGLVSRYRRPVLLIACPSSSIDGWYRTVPLRHYWGNRVALCVEVPGHLPLVDASALLKKFAICDLLFFSKPLLTPCHVSPFRGLNLTSLDNWLWLTRYTFALVQAHCSQSWDVYTGCISCSW